MPRSFHPIRGLLQASLGAGHTAGNARVALAGKIHRLGERLEQRLDDMVRFVPVKQFQMEIAPGLVGEGLKKFARQTETERAGHVLPFFRCRDLLVGQATQAAPDEAGSPAEINHAAGEALVHRHASLAGERIARMKARAVTPDALLLAQRPGKRLPEDDAAILDRVVGVHRQIAPATERQIHDGVFGKQGEHVIEKRDAGLDGRLARSVNVQLDRDASFLRRAFNCGLPGFHAEGLNRLPPKTKPNPALTGNALVHERRRPVQRVRQKERGELQTAGNRLRRQGRK